MKYCDQSHDSEGLCVPKTDKNWDILSKHEPLHVAAAIAICAMVLTLPINAFAEDADTSLHDWEVRRLMHPSPQELRDEKSGKVYIYDGLTDREVDEALDSHFDRIQSMMFVGTIRTDAQGQQSVDSGTGEPMQESGGCGN